MKDRFLLFYNFIIKKAYTVEKKDYLGKIDKKDNIFSKYSV